MKRIIGFLIILMPLFGCKENTTESTLSGDIVGKIVLYADNGLALQDNSGIQISMEGRSFSTLSSTDGSWKLTNVPAGIYTVTFSKTGFTTRKNFNFQFVGGGTYYFGSMNLGQLPSASITQLQFIKRDSMAFFTIQGRLSSADSLQRNIRIVFDTKPFTISPTMTFLFWTDAAIPPDSLSFSFIYGFYDYINTSIGVSTGSKLYFRAFVLPRAGYYGNYNPANGNDEYYTTGLSFTNLDSLIVP